MKGKRCGIEDFQVGFNLLFFQFGYKIWTKDIRMQVNTELR